MHYGGSFDLLKLTLNTVPDENVYEYIIPPDNIISDSPMVTWGDKGPESWQRWHGWHGWHGWNGWHGRWGWTNEI